MKFYFLYSFHHSEGFLSSKNGGSLFVVREWLDANPAHAQPYSEIA